MKKTILLAVLFLLAHSLILAQHYTWTERSAAGSRNWRAVASSANGGKLVALVDYPGYVHSSADSGATWTAKSSMGFRLWGSIASSSDGAKLVIGLLNEYIQVSIDSGEVWFPTTSSGPRNWTSVASSSNGTKLVAADATPGYIYTSTNSGYKWTAQTSSGEKKWSSIASSSDGTSLAAVHDSTGYIYTSTNTGVTWTAQTSAGARKWSSIAISADGAIIVAADATPGYIYTSTNAGLTWTPQTASGARKWSSVASSAGGSRLVAVDSTPGYIYISTNSGVTWTAQTAAGARSWRSVATSSDGTKVIAVASNSNIFTGVFIPNSIATSSVSDTSYCQGTSLSIPFTVLGIYDGNNVFTAQLSDSVGSFTTPTTIGTLTGTASGAIDATIPLSIPTGNSYRIRVISSSPATMGTSSTENITLHALPARFTVTGGGGYCVGDTGVAVGLSNSQIGVRYQLQNDGVDTLPPQEGTGVAINFGTQTDSGTYSILAIDSTTGCMQMQGNVKVSVYPLPPKPTITKVGNELSSSSNTGNLWYLNNQHLGGVTSKTYTPTTSGKYSVRATLNICVSPMSEVFDFIVDTEKVTAGFNASVTKGTAPLTINFTDATTGNPTSWTWDFGDTQTSTQQNPAHTYTTPGNYTVKLTASNAITNDTKTKESFIIVEKSSSVTNDGSGDTQKKVHLTSIPNPATDEAIVRIESGTRTLITLSLYNVLGNKVQDIYTGEIGIGSTDIRYTVKDATIGNYYLMARYSGGTVMGRLQVVR